MMQRAAMSHGSVAMPSASGEARRSPAAALPAQLRRHSAPLGAAVRLRAARPAAMTTSAVTTIEKKGADIWNKSYYPKGEDMVATEKAWVVIDAKGQRLGRMSTLIANYLRGANMPSYHPSCDTGSFVVVINAEQVVVTGKKAEQKTYHRSFNGRPGSHKVRRSAGRPGSFQSCCGAAAAIVRGYLFCKKKKHIQAHFVTLATTMLRPGGDLCAPAKPPAAAHY